MLALLDTLPLVFEANRGQFDGPAEFIARTHDYNLYLEQTKAVLSFPPVDGEACETDEKRNEREQEEIREQGPINCSGQPIEIRLGFGGASKSEPRRITGLNELPGQNNYLIGNDPKKWHIGVPLYSKVGYENLYPGIDLVFHGTQRNLEFDFIVGSGADPGLISLRFDEQQKVWIDKRGNLVLSTPTGEMRVHRPRVFQEISSGQNPKVLAGRYVVKGDGLVGFVVDSYDPGRPLVIDPVLSYSSYLHGSLYDSAQGIAVDSSGFAYITGYTISPDYPVTSGAFQTHQFKWTMDAIVTKLNPSASGASSLIWSTFLGGGADDVGRGIALNSVGNVFVVGQTYSANFPVTSGSFQGTLPNTNGAGFVSELNSTGSSLVYSTYLGGSILDEVRAIAVDSQNNAYVTGRTYSIDFPTTNAIQSSKGAGTDSDAFVTELNASGSGLIFSTFLGGTAPDQGNGIALDPSTNIYVAGSTRSSDFPLLAAIQSTCSACANHNNSAFVTEIAAGGVGLRYSTYLGGSGENQARAIGVDLQGNTYVTGFTSSVDFPTTAGAFQTSLQGSAGAFVSKISPNGLGLVYSTLLTGSNIDFGDKIAVSAGGNAYVTGQTFSSNFPTVLPTQASCNSCVSRHGTVFVTEMNVSGSSPVFSTFLGGSNYDEGVGIAVDPSGNAYMAGDTYSTDFTTTSTAYQTSSDAAGNLNAFMAKIGLTPSASVAPASLVFASQAQGTTSAAQVVTLSDTGTAQLNITSITTSGDFGQTNTCGTVIGAGGSCTINVTFSPQASGTRNGTLTINDNASGSPQTVNLTGNGSGALTATVSPASQTFNNQNVGVTSPPQLVTLTNTGNVALTISGIVASGDYAQTNGCGSSLAGNSNCTISVTFTPTAVGTRTGTIVLTDNASSSPQIVNLTGTGVGGPAVTNLSPTSGAVGAAVTVTGTNFGATQGTSTVQFNGTSAMPTSWSATSIVVPVPAGATTGNVVVTVSAVASNGVSFTVTKPIAVIQHKSVAATGTSLALAFTSNITSGNLIVVAVSTYTGETISSPTDTSNNSYALAVSDKPPTTGTPSAASIYYAVAKATGALTITAHISAADNIHLHIYEISGLSSTLGSVLDHTGSNLQAPTTSATVSGATTVSNEYVFAFFAGDNSTQTWTKGGSYTDIETSNRVGGDSSFSEDIITTSAGMQTATATFTSMDRITSVIATFKP